jgi:hypothetical protein
MRLAAAQTDCTSSALSSSTGSVAGYAQFVADGNAVGSAASWAARAPRPISARRSPGRWATRRSSSPSGSRLSTVWIIGLVYLLLAFPSGQLQARLDRALVIIGLVAAVRAGAIAEITVTPTPTAITSGYSARSRACSRRPGTGPR